MVTYRIFFASGDRLRASPDGGDPEHRDSREVFTAAEAAEIVSRHPYAWLDAHGDITVSTYSTRCGAGQYKPVTGRQMAARLRGRRPASRIPASLRRS
jgi:hypothetical protein